MVTLAGEGVVVHLEPLEHQTLTNLLRERPGEAVLRQIQGHELLKPDAESWWHGSDQAVHGQVKNLQLLQAEEGFGDRAGEPRPLQEQPPEAAVAQLPCLIH